jgi:putative hydrolase of the HAD superfamily
MSSSLGEPAGVRNLTAGPPIEPRPQVVFLDVGDTLVRAHPSWAFVYRGVLAQHGIDVDEDTLRAALEQTFGEGGDYVEGPFAPSREASYQRLKSFDSRVLAVLGYAQPDDAFFRALEEAFTVRSAWWVFEDVLPALDAMLAAGLRLGVISNWTWNAPELLHTLDLARHFEAMIISDRVGYLKPHARIFEHALGVLGVKASQAVHVGDSIRSDVKGALGAGIQPVLIDRGTHVHRDGTRPLPPYGVPVVGDLLELLDLLLVPRPATGGST